MNFTPKDIARFWRKVNKNGPVPQHKPQLGPCWIWTAGLNEYGYGQFWLGDTNVIASRASAVINTGKDIPIGLFILHHCDCCKCVNPGHLFIGTQAENMQDMVQKSRSATGDRSGARVHPEKYPAGSQRPNSKLTESQAVEIRRLYATGNFSQIQLAKMFHVSTWPIWSVVRRAGWTHIA